MVGIVRISPMRQQVLFLTAKFKEPSEYFVGRENGSRALLMLIFNYLLESLGDVVIV